MMDWSTLGAKLSLADKVGQLLMIGFEGKKPRPEVARLLSEGKAGGVILLARNFDDADEAAALIGDLQQLAAASPSGLPLLIAVDQEGGSVVRLTKGVTVFPGNMALGATGRPDLAYRAAFAVAGELAPLGINMNFAPVVDVNNNPRNPVVGVRSFGEDPRLVAEFGAEAVRGYQNGGVAAVAKHFPGHGDTTTDSHLGMPQIPHPLTRLEEVELVPFQRAITAGVAGIMTTHASFPAVEPDPGRPATLSTAALTGLLRQQLGFNGLIITDCLEMGGVANAFGTEQAAVLAVQAGADLALITHSYARQLAAHRMLIENVRRGLIAPCRIDEAVGRIIRLKQELFSVKNQPPDTEGNNQALAKEIAAAALTLVKNEGGLLPLNLGAEEELVLLSCQSGGVTLAEEGNGGMVGGFARALMLRHPLTRERKLSISPEAGEIDTTIRELLAKRPGLVLVATADAGLFPGQVALVKRVAATGLPVVVIALRTPYELAFFPEVKAFVAAYGFRAVTFDALASLLWGEFLPVGKLPVEIPGLYPAGHGLERF